MGHQGQYHHPNPGTVRRHITDRWNEMDDPRQQDHGSWSTNNNNNTNNRGHSQYQLTSHPTLPRRRTVDGSRNWQDYGYIGLKEWTNPTTNDRGPVPKNKEKESIDYGYIGLKEWTNPKITEQTKNKKTFERSLKEATERTLKEKESRRSVPIQSQHQQQRYTPRTQRTIRPLND